MFKIKQSLAILVIVLVAATCRADDKAIRKEMEADYQAIVKGVIAKNTAPMKHLLTSDFTMEEKGRKMDANAAVAVMEGEFKQMQAITENTMTIQTLKIEKNQAIATVTRKYKMTFKTVADPKGTSHVVSGSGIDEDVWIKTKDGWRIKFIKTLNSTVTLDGQPVKQ